MMNLELIGDWKWVLKKAWSMRLMALATVLQVMEFMLPYFLPRFPSAGLTIVAALVTAAAFVARLVAQRRDSTHD